MSRTPMVKFIDEHYEGFFRFIGYTIMYCIIIPPLIIPYGIPWLISKIPGCSEAWSDFGFIVVWVSIFAIIFIIKFIQMFF